MGVFWAYIITYYMHANNSWSQVVAFRSEIMSKDIFNAFFMWKSEERKENLWILGVPFIGVGTVL